MRSDSHEIPPGESRGKLLKMAPRAPQRCPACKSPRLAPAAGAGWVCVECGERIEMTEDPSATRQQKGQDP